MKGLETITQTIFQPVKKVTQVEAYHISNAEVKNQICKLLNLTLDTYCHYQYISGLEFARRYFATACNMIGAAERSKLYWNWWKLHWLNRDQAFLTPGIEKISIENRMALYTATHDMDALLEEIYPGAEVRQDIYGILGINLKNCKHEKESQKVA